VQAQEIFDKVVDHLATQKKQSRALGNGKCAYRTEDGLKCAAGCLIPDSAYSSDMECITFVGVISRMVEGSVADSFRLKDSLYYDVENPEIYLELAPHHDLVSALQVVHDEPMPYEAQLIMREIWSHGLNKVARDNNLVFDARAFVAKFNSI
jgi:hypothetical protein